jgi:WD40 repeat protein
VKIYKKNPTCPYCRRPFGLPLPPINDQLRALAEKFLVELEKRERGEKYDKTFYDQTESFLMTLPDEVIVDIFTFLPFSNLGTMSRVCKQVRPVADDSFLWRTHVNREFPFCNAQDFGNDWKNCFRTHSRLKIGWETGRAKDFKMTPLRGHNNYISCFDFYRQHVVSGSGDSKVMLWKVNNTKPIHSLISHTAEINCIKFNEMFIVSGSNDRTARVWDCTSGICMSTINHNGRVMNLAFNDNTLYTASSDTSVRTCDLRTGAIARTYNAHNHDVLNIIIGNPGNIISTSHTEIKVWDTRNDNVLQTINATSRIKCVAYSGNNTLVLGEENGSLAIYNTQNGNQLYRGIIHNGSINCLHTDGNYVVTGSNDGTLKEFNMQTNTVVHHLIEHNTPVNSVQFDGVKIVSGAADNCMKVWKRKTGERLYSLLGGSLQQRGNNPPHPTKVGCSQLMFDNSRVIGAFNSLLRVYSFLFDDKDDKK